MPNAQCPMPNAQCPMPNAHYLKCYSAVAYVVAVAWVAGADIARQRAGHVHEARVAIALPVGSPRAAAGVGVLTRRLAHATAHGTLAVGEVRVFGALAQVRPARALRHVVLALGRADAAARRAVAQHEVCIALALTAERPRHASRVGVGAGVLADAARAWAGPLHDCHDERARVQDRKARVRFERSSCDAHSGLSAQCESFAHWPHSCRVSLHMDRASGNSQAVTTAAARRVDMVRARSKASRAREP